MDSAANWHKLAQGLCRVEGEVWRQGITHYKWRKKGQSNDDIVFDSFLSGPAPLLSAQPLSTHHPRTAWRDSQVKEKGTWIFQVSVLGDPNCKIIRIRTLPFANSDLDTDSKQQI